MAAAAPADKERILNDSVPTFREAAGAVDPAGRRLLRMEGDQGPEGQAALTRLRWKTAYRWIAGILEGKNRSQASGGA
jgi:hypothetical protein